MNPIQNTKTVQVLPPEAKDNADFAAPTPVDTAGFGHIRFQIATGIVMGDIGSDTDVTPLKVVECDTSGGVFDDKQGAALVAPLTAIESSKNFAIDINLQDGTHKRYMKVAQPHVGDGSGTPSNLAITAILSKPDGNGPANAAGQGLEELIKA